MPLRSTGDTVQHPPAISSLQHAQLRTAVQNLLWEDSVAPKHRALQATWHGPRSEEPLFQKPTNAPDAATAQSFYYVQRPLSSLPQRPHQQPVRGSSSADRSSSGRHHPCDQSSDRTTATYRITSASSEGGSLRTASSGTPGSYVIPRRPEPGGYRGPSSEGNSPYHSMAPLTSGSAAAPFSAAASTLREVSQHCRAGQGLARARSEGRSFMSIPAQSFNASGTESGGGGAPVTTAEHSVSVHYAQFAALQPQNRSGSGSGTSVLLSLPLSNDASVTSVATPPSASTRTATALAAAGYYNRSAPSSFGAYPAQSAGQPHSHSSRGMEGPSSMGGCHTPWQGMQPHYLSLIHI